VRIPSYFLRQVEQGYQQCRPSAQEGEHLSEGTESPPPHCSEEGDHCDSYVDNMHK